MFEHFTDTSRMAVAIANHRTHQLGGGIIGEVELLLGIVEVEGGVGAAVLRELNVDLEVGRSLNGSYGKRAMGLPR